MVFSREVIYLLIETTEFMRVNWQQVARNWTQFQSRLPSEHIEPVVVADEKKNNKVEWIEAFNALVELSWIDMPPDEVIKQLGYRILTDEEWQPCYVNSNGVSDWVVLEREFLYKFYSNHRAYVKCWDEVIYWKVYLSTSKFYMETEKGVIAMPAMWIEDELSRENKYIFFPIKALLEDWEQAFFRLNNTIDTHWDTMAIEKQIMELLIKLTTVREKKPTVIESNVQLKEIEDICRESWVVKEIYCSGWNLVLSFDWRYAIDTDWAYERMVLPPVDLKINLWSLTVRWNSQYHPHVLSDYSLCMGWRLTGIVQDCIQKRDLKTLIAGMLDFANSWTSSDVGRWDRHPGECIMRYHSSNTTDWTNIPVDKDDILRTIECRWHDASQLGQAFVNLFSNQQ